jgi:hypothetical protein
MKLLQNKWVERVGLVAVTFFTTYLLTGGARDIYNNTFGLPARLSVVENEVVKSQSLGLEVQSIVVELTYQMESQTKMLKWIREDIQLLKGSDNQHNNDVSWLMDIIDNNTL